MSKTIHITSPSQLASTLSSHRLVVADFYADWCAPCRAIAPLYETLSASLSRPSRIAFLKIDTDAQKQIAQSYNISAMPTFLIFKAGREVHRVQGADQKKLNEAVRRLAVEAEKESAGGEGSSGGGGGSEEGGRWRAFELTRPYGDVTDQVDVRGLDVLNSDGAFGGPRGLFGGGKPSGLAKGKGKGKEAGAAGKDWMESDTDEQLMLYVPFQSTVKIHGLQVTSLPGSAEDGDGDDDDDDERPMRPAVLRLYSNRAHNLGFEEADDTAPTQEVEIKESDWDEATGTARVDLRFVKFQNVTSLVIFVVKGLGDGEKTRIDRIRVVGETGQKRDPGKLEKVGHDE